MEFDAKTTEDLIRGMENADKMRSHINRVMNWVASRWPSAHGLEIIFRDDPDIRNQCRFTIDHRRKQKWSLFIYNPERDSNYVVPSVDKITLPCLTEVYEALPDILTAVAKDRDAHMMRILIELGKMKV